MVHPRATAIRSSALRAAFRSRRVGELSDCALLERFLAHADILVGATITDPPRGDGFLERNGGVSLPVGA
jgi:hypothetical protein